MEEQGLLKRIIQKVNILFMVVVMKVLQQQHLIEKDYLLLLVDLHYQQHV